LQEGLCGNAGRLRKVVSFAVFESKLRQHTEVVPKVLQSLLERFLLVFDEAGGKRRKKEKVRKSS
jgi:hypothetical protein